jgi:hypothetical protein
LPEKNVLEFRSSARFFAVLQGGESKMQAKTDVTCEICPNRRLLPVPKAQAETVYVALASSSTIEKGNMTVFYE